MQKIRVLYIMVGEGGSDHALLTSLQYLKGEVEAYVLLGRRATANTLKMLEEAHVPYEVWKYKFFWWNGVPYRFLKHLQMVKLWWQRHYWKKKVIQKVKQWDIQLIHTNTSAYQFGLLAARALKIPHVWHFREYQTLDFNKLHAFSLNSVMALSSTPGNYNIAITKGIYDFYRFSDRNSRIIYDAVAKSFVQEVKVDSPFFLYVGRLVVEKGLFCLLHAYEKYCLQGGSCHLYLVGELSSEVSSYLEGLKQHPLILEKIHICGKQSIPVVYGYMQQAEALIVPSPFEAFGLITAEAMLNHCLVLGRDVAGTQEQMDNGLSFTGDEIAVRFKSEDDLVECLKRVACQGTLDFISMKERAYRTVVSLYDVTMNASCLLDVYRKLVIA